MSDSFAETGLKFFGTVSASISHEIKNRMAVINEQAGLLKDLVHLAGQGREMSLERLLRLSDSLKTQVDLTDGIIRNMNRFSHSVDSFMSSSNVGEMLELTAALANRTAANKCVRIELKLPTPSPSINTSPFWAMNLIWLCLEAMMPYATMDTPVMTGCEKTEAGVTVWLSTDRWPETGGPVLPEAVTALSDALQAVIVLNSEEKMLRIGLPSKTCGEPSQIL